jgi:hypothetical protein
LALETVAFALAAGSRDLPHTAFAAIEALARIMGMEEVITDALRQSVKQGRT